MGDAEVRKRASWCGRHLAESLDWILANAEQPERRPRTGCSHGASGIAYALYWLFQKPGEPESQSVAKAAPDYEARVFNPNQANWPDF